MAARCTDTPAVPSWNWVMNRPTEDRSATGRRRSSTAKPISTASPASVAQASRAKVSQPPLAIAAATQPPAVSASAPPASAPRYGEPTTITPRPTIAATSAGRHGFAGVFCAPHAASSRTPAMNAPSPTGPMPGVAAAGRGRVADDAVELKMRAGQHVDADDTGADRRGRADRPERAPAPRPDAHGERGQRREARTDEAEREPGTPGTPPRHDVGEHRGRDRHRRGDQQPLDDPYGPAATPAAARPRRPTAGPAAAAGSPPAAGPSRRWRTGRRTRPPPLAVRMPGGRRRRASRSPRPGRSGGRRPAAPAHRRTAWSARRCRGRRGRSEPGRPVAGSRSGRCWSRSASRRRIRDRRRSRRAAGTRRRCPTGRRPAPASPGGRAARTLARLASTAWARTARVGRRGAADRAEVDDRQRALAEQRCRVGGQRRGVPVDAAERAGRRDGRAGADGDGAPDRLGQGAGLGAEGQIRVVRRRRRIR